MSRNATYEEGHLVVAAVRILDHRNGHPPTVDEVAELVKLQKEWTGVLVSELTDLGILRRVESAFTLRLEVGRHEDLEKLPRAAEAPSLNDEMKAFAEKQKREHEAMSRLFTGEAGKQQKKKRMSELQKELDAFKSRPSKGADLFRELTEED